MARELQQASEKRTETAFIKALQQKLAAAETINVQLRKHSGALETQLQLLQHVATPAETEPVKIQSTPGDQFVENFYQNVRRTLGYVHDGT